MAAPTLTVLAGSAVALAGTLAVRAVMARALEPDSFGLLITAIALVTATGGIANFGINPAAALRVGEGLAADDREMASRAARTALIFGTASGLVAATSIALFAPIIATWFAADADRATLTASLRALAPVALLMPIGGAALGVYRAHGRTIARALIRDGGGGIARAIGVAIAAVLGGGIASLGLGYSAGVVLAEGGFAVEVLRRGWLTRRPQRADTPDPRLDGELIQQLPPLGALEILAQGRMWLDVLAISLLAPPSVVGIYGLARSLARGLEVVFHAGVHRYLPAVGRTAPAERPALANDTRRFVLGVITVPVAVGLAAPAAPVLLLAGQPYIESAPVLAWLSLAVLVEALFGYQDQSLLALGRSRAVAVIDGGALLVYGSLLALLIPRSGALGAAWALVIVALTRGISSALVLTVLGRNAPRSSQRIATLAGWPMSPRLLGVPVFLGLGVLLTESQHQGIVVDTVFALCAGVLGVLALYGGRESFRRA